MLSVGEGQPVNMEYQSEGQLTPSVIEEVLNRVSFSDKMCRS